MSYQRTGVAQVLSRLNAVATMSHCRRVNQPIGKEIKNTELRQVHQSTMFYIDPHETPEGALVGVTKNLAATVTISTHVPLVDVANAVNSLLPDAPLLAGCVGLGALAARSGLLFLNGRPHMVLLNMSAAAVADRLRAARRQGLLHASVSVSTRAGGGGMGHVSVQCDDGRLVRPLFILHQEPDSTHGGCEILAGRCLELLDASEIEDMVLAMDADAVQPWHTHMELHPTALMGTTCASIVFANHNQAPRVCYFSSMVKQAVGTFALNWRQRFDTSAHVLDSVQKPLVSTEMARSVLHGDSLPNSVNCIVAVMCYGGWSQEDCVMVNKAAVERGLFASTGYRTLACEERGNEACRCVFGIPPPEAQRSTLSYAHLDAAGLPRVGSRIVANDVLVGRVQWPESGETAQVCASVVATAKEEGFVDAVHLHTTEDGDRVLKVRIRAPRVLEMGDKVAQTSGQKGTVGLIVPQEDMPFTASGMVPDILLNPHAVPSRMTISMLLDMGLGKVCAVLGKLGDGTPFTDATRGAASKIADALDGCGYARNGTETMYNGMTGEKLEADIFIGITCYHKLKHMVSDKLYARGVGPVSMLTCQPVRLHVMSTAFRLTLSKTNSD